MDKQQTLLVAITVLMAVTAVCSVYSAYTDYQSGHTEKDTYDSIKAQIDDLNTHGGNIYVNGTSMAIGGSTTVSDLGDRLCLKTSTSTIYIPYSQISAIKIDH